MSLNIKSAGPVHLAPRARLPLPACTKGCALSDSITTCLLFTRPTVRARPNSYSLGQRGPGLPLPWGPGVLVGPICHLHLAFGGRTKAQGPSVLTREPRAHHSRARESIFIKFVGSHDRGPGWLFIVRGFLAWAWREEKSFSKGLSCLGKNRYYRKPSGPRAPGEEMGATLHPPATTCGMFGPELRDRVIGCRSQWSQLAPHLAGERA